MNESLDLIVALLAFYYYSGNLHLANDDDNIDDDVIVDDNIDDDVIVDDNSDDDVIVDDNIDDDVIDVQSKRIR